MTRYDDWQACPHRPHHRRQPAPPQHHHHRLRHQSHSPSPPTKSKACPGSRSAYRAQSTEPSPGRTATSRQTRRPARDLLHQPRPEHQRLRPLLHRPGRQHRRRMAHHGPQRRSPALTSTRTPSNTSRTRGQMMNDNNDANPARLSPHHRNDLRRLCRGERATNSRQPRRDAITLCNARTRGQHGFRLPGRVRFTFASPILRSTTGPAITRPPRN